MLKFVKINEHLFDVFLKEPPTPLGYVVDMHDRWYFRPSSEFGIARATYGETPADAIKAWALDRMKRQQLRQQVIEGILSEVNRMLGG